MDRQTVNRNLTNDRLSSTLFLAILFHGVVILGVSFTATFDDLFGDNPTLEVVLVTDEAASEAPPEEADYIAQQNMSGSGQDEDQTRSARLAPAGAPIEVDGRDNGNHVLDSRTTPVNAIPRLLASNQPSMQLTAVETESHAESYHEPLLAQRLVASTDFLQPTDEYRRDREIRKSDEREHFISVNTRESDVAEYLAQWKSRVERLGTIRFPAAARQNELPGTPTLEVAINADGSLHRIVILRSSGHKPLDQAALEIVQLASPFEPFPEDLRGRYDVLRFAYEWHFEDGTTSVVSAGTDRS